MRRGVDAFFQSVPSGVPNGRGVQGAGENTRGSVSAERQARDGSTFAVIFGYDPREKEIANSVQGSSAAMVEVRLKILHAAPRNLPVQDRDAS